mgnify:CR=1 FL=1
MTISERNDLLVALRGLAPSTPYARGVLDVLRLLNLVRADSAGPTGEIAGYVLASLGAHIEDGVAVCFDWNDLDAAGLRGADVLRAWEAARLAAVSRPTPGRVVQVAQAVIKARRGEEDRYLMQWDAHARRYQPLGGKREPGDPDTASTLRREIGEELGLDHTPTPDECGLALLLGDWGTEEISAAYGIYTRYSIDYYAVTRIGFPIHTGDDTRWLARSEIAAGRAEDGRAVSMTYQQALGWDRLDALLPCYLDGGPG